MPTRKLSYVIAALFCLACLTSAWSLTATAETVNFDRTRVAILADMGNEPDEEQQIVHLMLYANMMDLQALIAVTGKYLHPGAKAAYRRRLYPDLFHKIIDGYDAVLPKLEMHADGWPTANYLRSIVFTGQTHYGIDSVGEGLSSPGSKRLESLLTNDDPRPLYVVVNAGSNTLAQAIVDLEKKLSPPAFNQSLAKLRVFENGAQDNAGAWIMSKYPSIHWVRSNHQTYSFGGPSWDSNKGEQDRGKNLGPHTWQPYEYSALGQHQWALEHILGNHGKLGKLWPIRTMGRGQLAFIEGGGTIPWLGLAQPGLSDINFPHWGGWSGRFTRTPQANVWSKHKDIQKDEAAYGSFAVITEAGDTWINPEDGEDYSGLYAPVWRWRRAFFNDFRARMDWAHFEFADANHNPVIKIHGLAPDQVIQYDIAAGQKLSFDASSSVDPDGDKLVFRWWIYEEASTANVRPKLRGHKKPKVTFKIPKHYDGGEIHLILELRDDSDIIPLYDYQRIVLKSAQ